MRTREVIAKVKKFRELKTKKDCTRNITTASAKGKGRLSNHHHGDEAS